jgi:hypothetical protein
MLTLAHVRARSRRFRARAAFRAPPTHRAPPLPAQLSGDDATLAPADAWCRLALARAAGRMPSADDLTAVAAVG